MTNYKLLGKEPTKEMLRNAHKNDCPSARETFIAMWEAAPEVKQEPVVIAHRLLWQDHEGEWGNHGRPWVDGKPDPKLLSEMVEPNSRWRIEYAYAYPPDAQAEIERLKAVIEKCRAALNEVTDLVSESSGVYGLHLNSDVSPWDEILAGGRFERLTSLDEAVYGIKEVKE